jgi:signal transduction histidine kinase
MPDRGSPAEPARGPAPLDHPEVRAKLAALEHEIALRDEFISTVAHELRNPLSPAYMQLEHIKDVVRRSDGPIAREWLSAQLDAMTARFDRFLQSLNRLLDASRLGDGHLVLMPEHCDLVAVTRAVLAGAERELGAARCAIVLDAPDTVPGWWDPLRLEQIIGNLLSNAIRYGAGQPIEIRITASADTARFVIRDRGIGIAADDLPRIFQRFARARNVGRSAGYGIGLWVVAELCRAMAGTVEAHSVVGHGATFTLTLPRGGW